MGKIWLKEKKKDKYAVIYSINCSSAWFFCFYIVQFVILGEINNGVKINSFEYFLNCIVILKII